MPTNNKLLLNKAVVGFFKTGTPSHMDDYIRPHCKSYAIFASFPTVSTSVGYDIVVIDSQSTALSAANITAIKQIVDSGVNVIVSSSVTRTNAFFDHSFDRNLAGDRIQGAHLTNRHPTLDYKIAAGDRASHTFGFESTTIGFAYSLKLGSFPLYYRSDVNQNAYTGVGYISSSNNAMLWFDLIGLNPSVAPQVSKVFIDDLISAGLRYKWHGIGIDNQPQIGEFGINTPHFNEAGQTNYCIKATGTGNRSVEIGNLPSVTLAGIELLPTSVRNQPNNDNGGFSLVIFNNDFTLKENPVFYNTATDTTVNNLATKINSLTTEPFALVSIQGFRTNANLDSAMVNKLKSNEWRGSSFYNTYTRKYSYACIGRADLGITTERTFFSDPVYEPESHCSTTVNSVNDFGLLGYGKPIIDWIEPALGTGNAQTASVSLIPNQHLIITASGQIGRTAAIAGSPKIVNWEFRNNANSVLGSGSIQIKSCGVSIKYTSKVVPPAGTTKIFMYHTGPGVVDFINVMKGGTYIPVDPSTNITACGINSPNLANSVVSGSPYTPESWKKLHASDSNLLKGIQFPSSLNQPVYWCEDTLTTSLQRGYYTTSSNSISEITINFNGTVNIPYVLAAWNSVITKTTGYIAFAVKFLTALDQTINNISTFGTGSKVLVNNPRLAEIYPANASEQWNLCYGFLMPHNWSDAKCFEFVSKYKEFYGVATQTTTLGNTMKGIGPEYDISGASTDYAAGFLRVPSTAAKMVIRFLDLGNTASSTAQWAFPVVAPMSVASFDATRLITVGLNS